MPAAALCRQVRIALLRQCESNRDSDHAFRQVRLRDQSGRSGWSPLSRSRTASLTSGAWVSGLFRGAGAFGLAVDASERFLYVANPSASNPPPYASTIGNISGFNIDSDTGALTPMLGSPFTATTGNGPTAITVDPSGRFVYAIDPGIELLHLVFHDHSYERTTGGGDELAVQLGRGRAVRPLRSQRQLFLYRNSEWTWY